MRAEDHSGTGRSKKSRSERRFREMLFQKQDGKCFWCLRAMELAPTRITERGNIKENPAYASFEHLLPKYRGGLNVRANIVLAHISCNNKRASKKWPHDPVYGVRGSPIPEPPPETDISWLDSWTTRRNADPARPAQPHPTNHKLAKIPYAESIMIMRHGKDHWKQWKASGAAICACCARPNAPLEYGHAKSQEAFENVYRDRLHMLRVDAPDA